MNRSLIKTLRGLNWPNRISLLRLLLVAPFVVLIMDQQSWAPGRYLALLTFVLMAVSDAADGLLARRLKLKTRLGAILDPLADKVMIICSAVLLSMPASMVPAAPLPNWAVVAIVGKDLWVVAGFLVIYLVTDKFLVRPTVAGKLCTFGQIIMVGCTLIAPDVNRFHADLGTWAAYAWAWLVLVLCVVAAASYMLLGLRFIAAEQKPLDENGHASR